MNKHGYPVEFHSGLPICKYAFCGDGDEHQDCKKYREGNNLDVCRVSLRRSWICGPLMVKMLHECDHKKVEVRGYNHNQTMLVFCEACGHRLTLKEVKDRLNHED